MSDKLRAGTYVYFDDIVYEEPYSPYYDKYKDHKFRVVKTHRGDHYELICVSDKNIKVDGYVHRTVLKKVN